jgi:tRNA-2-methylthio-N6-dimethylallyladenosine synthase
MTRGPEVHRPADQIVAEVRRLAAAGVVEVTLLGQTINHYEHVDDRGRRTTFADLLRRVHDEVPQLPRLRFVTSFPRDFTDDALRAMADSPRICRYLHIPAQSGSNAVLKRMNRGYTVEQYRDLLDRAHRLMPDVAISGDFIAGFPGETEDDFAASVELVRSARYKNCFIFKYSPRPGTHADQRFPDDVPDDVKRRRNNDLLAVQAEMALANHREMIDTTVEVLVEGYSKAALRAQQSEQERGAEVDHDAEPRRQEQTQAAGFSPRVAGQLVGRTRGDQIVVFNGPPTLIGRMIDVRIAAATAFTLHGALDRAPAEPPPRRSAPPLKVALPLAHGATA